MRKGLKLNRRAFAVLAPLALAACAGQTMQGTSGAKNADVARVENYFRTVDLENAPFLQTWANGSRGGGLITYKPDPCICTTLHRMKWSFGLLAIMLCLQMPSRAPKPVLVWRIIRWVCCWITRLCYLALSLLLTCKSNPACCSFRSHARIILTRVGHAGFS